MAGNADPALVHAGLVALLKRDGRLVNEVVGKGRVSTVDLFRRFKGGLAERLARASLDYVYETVILDAPDPTLDGESWRTKSTDQAVTNHVQAVALLADVAPTAEAPRARARAIKIGGKV